MSDKIDLKDPILNEHIRLHLQFIQNTITRMNTNSFQIKTDLYTFRYYQV